MKVRRSRGFHGNQGSLDEIHVAIVNLFLATCYCLSLQSNDIVPHHYSLTNWLVTAEHQVPLTLMSTEKGRDLCLLGCDVMMHQIEQLVF